MEGRSHMIEEIDRAVDAQEFMVRLGRKIDGIDELLVLLWMFEEQPMTYMANRLQLDYSEVINIRDSIREKARRILQDFPISY